ncbi:MAG: cytochrome b [Pseudomonadota bacterium]|nr:cytochrome b [Pseudomonadota bacterium]QKK05831.1 MAG: cytochrome b [Pseudomonadota bacterium]
MAAKLNKSSFENPVIRWVDERLPIFTMMDKEYGAYPTPKNFNYFWNFGAIAMVMLMLMIATGIFLAMNYTPHTSMAFDSVERIMRDVNYGWMLRYLHMNGSHFFFFAVYVHIFRGLYYGSYKQPRELLWIFGVLIFLLMMATAFMGYSLPWSQMSGWGVNVITNLFSAIPFFGDSIVTWLWGGPSVGNPTLNRFFALHFLLPFVIVGVVFLHVWALHITGSNNPSGVEPANKKDTVPFHPYYTIKDTFGLTVFMIAYMLIVFFAPLAATHADHFVPFDPMVTPQHIVPEWYFLPFYAILRSFTVDLHIPFTGFIIEHGIVFTAKLQGVIAMFGSVLILFVLPWLDKSPVRSSRYRPTYRKCNYLLLLAMFILGYAGSQPAEGTMLTLARCATGYYFLHFLAVIPYLSRNEKTLPVPKSINAAVLQDKEGAQ